MRTGDSAKRVFERRIFVKPPASDITITHINTTSQTLSGYYGYTKNTTSVSKTVGVPYTYVLNNRQFNSFGVTNDGQNKIAVPSSATLTVGDSITIEGKPDTYEVVSVTDLHYHNVTCGLIVTTKVRN